MDPLKKLLTPKVPLNEMALAKSATLKKLLTPKVPLNEMALAKSATSVVASRSLKWHLVPFRDFWSEKSRKGYLFCLKSPFSNYLVPFSKFWVAKKQSCHFYHRYANYWFWFCWSVYLGTHFQLFWSFFGPFFEKSRSLFGPFFEKLWSLFGPF